MLDRLSQRGGRRGLRGTGEWKRPCEQFERVRMRPLALRDPVHPFARVGVTEPAEIQRCAGSQFDAEVVQAFMGITPPELLELRKKVEPVVTMTRAIGDAAKPAAQDLALTGDEDDEALEAELDAEKPGS